MNDYGYYTFTGSFQSAGTLLDQRSISLYANPSVAQIPVVGVITPVFTYTLSRANPGPGESIVVEIRIQIPPQSTWDLKLTVASAPPPYHGRLCGAVVSAVGHGLPCLRTGEDIYRFARNYDWKMNAVATYDYDAANASVGHYGTTIYFQGLTNVGRRPMAWSPYEPENLVVASLGLTMPEEGGPAANLTVTLGSMAGDRVYGGMAVAVARGTTLPTPTNLTMGVNVTLGEERAERGGEGRGGAGRGGEGRGWAGI
ncbi:unnamed protein product [Darwinula stevensoni]|uniref:Uncharacterized protein n=1 Tax=Darwinula stevensoni TaxID=69355 RepID=A0A7R9FSM7_9CRUS|nr:unnamed protein product [Darwinula stevensoni]CAG0903481.1 unnamed protein product [Darwinula stevensoni]